MSFLAAFRNSIIAEVARLDTIATDQAKSDFILSISYKLRSPLYSILVSVEFLQDTAVDLFQNSIIDTIEQYKRTLLDTIQYILDFAKINNFTKPKRNKKKDKQLSDKLPCLQIISLSIDIDLSIITEDIIDTVYTGYKFQGNLLFEVTDKASSFPSEGL